MTDSAETFTALVLEEADGKVTPQIQTLDNGALPEGEVTVAVKYSNLNYKDGLIVKGVGRLVRDYPHVPGIDFAGVVEGSSSPDYAPGDEVLLTGWRVGERHWGGFATRARVQADWLVPLPEGLSLQQSMAIGTAGFTAMLAVMALEDHGLTPAAEGPETEREVLVTGAAGGAGSIATAILAHLGYRVAASTGRAETHAYLKDLGAASIVERAELAAAPRGPLASERWAGIIDNVGGEQLGHVLAALASGASCASIGNAGGIKFTATVLPFILRGVNLLGIDSNLCPKARRLKAWDRLRRDLPLDKLASITATAPLSQVVDHAGAILEGRVRGRLVLDVSL